MGGIQLDNLQVDTIPGRVGDGSGCDGRVVVMGVSGLVVLVTGLQSELMALMT